MAGWSINFRGGDPLSNELVGVMKGESIEPLPLGLSVRGVTWHSRGFMERLGDALGFSRRFDPNVTDELLSLADRFDVGYRVGSAFDGISGKESMNQSPDGNNSQSKSDVIKVSSVYPPSSVEFM